MRLLVVEDEEKLSKALKQGLTAKGHAVDTIGDGEKALTRASLHHKDYDLMVLDLSLPNVDGLTIARALRDRGITTPILVLTARNELGKKVELLNAGADDYLIKPFSFEELSARIEAIMRRPKTSLPPILQVGDITLNVSERTAYRGERTLELTLKEFMLLEYLMRHANEAVNREDLLSHLWDFNYESFSNVVDVHVKNLRHKLGDKSENSVLETVRGIGYRLRS